MKIKKALILFFLTFLTGVSTVLASDFILPNSSGEPIIIDISNLNLIQGIDVTVGEFTDQPRLYRNESTKSLVIFPPPVSSGEKTIQVRSGGQTVSKTVSFRPSPGGILKTSLLPGLVKARAGNSTVKISDGRIVLIGGSKSLNADPTDTIEIFDPESGKDDFLKTPNGLKNAMLNIPRSLHTATYLGINEAPVGMIVGPVEQILITGGFSQGGKLENSIEVLEIRAGTSESVSTLLTAKKSKLRKARIFHTASVLPDGRILIAGGQGAINKDNSGALNSIEIFDPITKTTEPSGITLSVPRLLHTATTLQDGNILIGGGFTNEKPNAFGIGPGTSVCELIDTKNLKIKKVGSLSGDIGIGGHSATLLTNGLVLILGGNSDFFSGVVKDSIKGLSVSNVQFYNPATENFSFASDSALRANYKLQVPRFLHSSVLLPNGDVAIIGGLNIKSSSNQEELISSPVSTVEVLQPDLINFSQSTLNIIQKPNLETSLGRILPSVVLVTPKNKIQGILSSSDANNFVNSALYLTGGFTNGFGRVPTKASELLQVETNAQVEGRQILTSPDALIRGSYLSELTIKLSDFNTVPALKVEPQTVNLSTSNNFIRTVKVLTTDNQLTILKAESPDSVIVSPSLFQTGESVTISRKDSSVSGEFEVQFLSTDPLKNFIEAKLKVNISESSKPFLLTVPPYGLSLSNQAGANSTNIQLKVFSQDGIGELAGISPATQVAAGLANPEIVNLGGVGISSVVGTLQTQYVINAMKPGKTSLSFSSLPDILGVSIPIEVTGTPTFPTAPIDTTVLANLSLLGIEFSNTERLNPTTVLLQDLRVSTTSLLFPIYVPINLVSSVDNSNVVGLFTVRPVFGVDILTAVPRTLINMAGNGFRQSSASLPTAVGGIVPSALNQVPLGVLAFNDGVKTIVYDQNVTKNIDEPFNKISNLSGVRDIELFEFGEENKDTKVVLLKGSMIFLLDAEDGEVETFSNLSDEGFELELVKIENKRGAVVSLGQKGIDLVFPVTDAEPRVVNFNIPGDIRNISVLEKLGNKNNPFVIAYDGQSTISIVDLVNVNAQIQTIDTEGEKIKKIDYGGKFQVNGKITDVLVAATQRKILLFDLNNLSSIPVNEDLKIKSQIEDMVVIDGIAYLALGSNGILAVSVGTLMDNDSKTKAEIAHFIKNILEVIKPNDRQVVISKPLHSRILADSKPFLLSSGEGNDLTVIRVSP